MAARGVVMATAMVRRLLLLGRLRAAPGALAAAASDPPSRAQGGGGGVVAAEAAVLNPTLGLGHGDVPPSEVNLMDKNPDYHGFSEDPVVDVWNMRMTFFFGISLAIVVGSAFVYYLPDRGMRQWARREAERRLKEREAAAVPAIGVNYFNPDRIVLPAGRGE